MSYCINIPIPPCKRTTLAAHGFLSLLMCLSKRFLNGCYLNHPSSTALVQKKKAVPSMSSEPVLCRSYLAGQMLPIDLTPPDFIARRKATQQTRHGGTVGDVTSGELPVTSHPWVLPSRVRPSIITQLWSGNLGFFLPCKQISFFLFSNLLFLFCFWIFLVLLSKIWHLKLIFLNNWQYFSG